MDRRPSITLADSIAKTLLDKKGYEVKADRQRERLKLTLNTFGLQYNFATRKLDEVVATPPKSPLNKRALALCRNTTRFRSCDKGK